MTDVVVLRPSTDAVERTLSIWVDLLLPPGTSLPGVQVVADLGAGTTPAAAQALCGSCDVVLYFGHGTKTALGDPVLLDGGSFGGLTGVTVVAVACLSGDRLGPYAVTQRGIRGYLGFSEPLFVYHTRPSVFGAEVANRVKAFLLGTAPLDQVRDHLEADLRAVEYAYHRGFYAQHVDAPLVWMGARMNWRGLVVH